MVERLSEGVWLLELGWIAPLASNAYVVDDGEDVTLVDAGLPWNATAIEAEIRNAGFDVESIDRVLITHYDLDHVGGLARLVPELDAPVFVGEGDADLLAGERDPPWLHHKGAFHRLVRPLFTIPAELPVRTVSDGDDVGEFTAYHTPGHNPGHMVYIHESLDVGLFGDLVWEQDGSLTPPVWLDSYDMDALHDSIRRVADRASPVEMACMGHGDPILTGGHDELVRLGETL